VKDLDNQVASATFIKPGVKFEEPYITAVEILRYKLQSPSSMSQEVQLVESNANTMHPAHGFAELTLRSRGGLSGTKLYIVQRKPSHSPLHNVNRTLYNSPTQHPNNPAKATTSPHLQRRRPRRAPIHATQRHPLHFMCAKKWGTFPPGLWEELHQTECVFSQLLR
jgi:hypothetical protein